jgi:hypothetical protein
VTPSASHDQTLSWRVENGHEESVMIDVYFEELFPLTEGPTGLKVRVSAATWWRWALKGKGGRRLESVVIGGRRYSSREAFDRFMNGLNVPESGQPPTSATRLLDQAQAAELAALTFLFTRPVRLCDSPSGCSSRR